MDKPADSGSSNYFNSYYDGKSYEETFLVYFDSQNILETIECVWKRSPPFRILDVGSASGLTLKEFSQRGVEAWGVEKDVEILSHTPSEFRRFNQHGDATKLPYEANYFDFAFETCFCYLKRHEIPSAVAELHRVVKEGVMLTGLAADLHSDTYSDPDLYLGVGDLLTFQEWADIFLKAGFTLAVEDESTLKLAWELHQKALKPGKQWYRSQDQLRLSLFSKKA